MKKLFLFLIAFFMININVYASTYVDSIDETIFIAKNGTATISEKWNINIDENYNNDEICKRINILEGSKLKNLQVIENTYNYQIIDSWDSNLSSDEKSYKASLTNNKICFSLNNYGNNTYTIRYDIENFAYHLNDSDLVYINYEFNALNLKINSLNIKIISAISLDNLNRVDISNNVNVSYEENNIIIDGNNIKDDVLITLKYNKDNFENILSIDNDYNNYAPKKSDYKIVIMIIIFAIILAICLLFIKKSKK